MGLKSARISWFYLNCTEGLILPLEVVATALFAGHAIFALEVFSAVIFLVFCLVFLRKPLLGMLTIAFLLPFEKFGSYSLNPAVGHPMIRLVQVASAAFILTNASRAIAGKLKLRQIKSLRYLLLFGLSALISAALVNYFRVWEIYLWVIFIIALFYCLAEFAVPENLPKIEKVLFWSAAVVAVYGLFQFVGDLAGAPISITGLTAAYTKKVFGFPRIQSTSIEPLYYANYLFIPIFIGLARLFTQKSRPRREQMGLAALIGLNFVLTMSRGAFIAFVPAVIIFAWLLKKELADFLQKYARGVLASIAIVLVTATAFLMVSSYLTSGDPLKAPKVFGSQITTLVFKTGSFTERVDQQRKAIAVIKAHPIFGVGIGGFAPWVYGYPPKRLAQDWEVVNNNELQLLAEGGLVGFALYFLFVGFIILKGYQRLRRESDPLIRAYLAGLIAAIVAIFIQYQSFSGFFITHIWFALALLAGLSATGAAKHLSLKNIRELL